MLLPISLQTLMNEDVTWKTHYTEGRFNKLIVFSLFMFIWSACCKPSPVWKLPYPTCMLRLWFPELGYTYAPSSLRFLCTIPGHPACIHDLPSPPRPCALTLHWAFPCMMTSLFCLTPQAGLSPMWTLLIYSISESPIPRCPHGWTPSSGSEACMRRHGLPPQVDVLLTLLRLWLSTAHVSSV